MALITDSYLCAHVCVHTEQMTVKWLQSHLLQGDDDASLSTHANWAALCTPPFFAYIKTMGSTDEKWEAITDKLTKIFKDENTLTKRLAILKPMLGR